MGCAFQICLERKQKRDRECSVTVEYSQNGTSFTRFGSFRTTSITERIIDPQSAIVAGLCSPLFGIGGANVCFFLSISRNRADPVHAHDRIALEHESSDAKVQRHRTAQTERQRIRRVHAQCIAPAR